jgi:3-methyladenine DNA glycosylase AlkD
MGKQVDKVRHDLDYCSDPIKAAHLPRFFQAYPGGYGEGDLFIGVTVPNQRKIARSHFQAFSLSELEELISDPLHECRLTAIFILILKFEKAKTEPEREALVKLYLDNLVWINNWDLVDSSAYKILGPYLFHRDRSVLYELAASGDLWKQRVAVMTTLFFIRNKDFDDILALARLLLRHEHDLMHKAIGWMLREVGNRNFDLEYDFLKQYYRAMPRTMLRYAIEKFEEDLRQKFLKGLV